MKKQRRPVGWITVPWIAWMIIGGMGLSRLPRLSWWFVVWAAATAGGACYAYAFDVGRQRGTAESDREWRARDAARRAFVEEHAIELRDRRN